MFSTIKLNLKSYLSSLAEKIFGQHLSGYVINSKNGLLACTLGSIFAGRSLARKGEYDWDIVQHFIQYINISSKILTVGSHIDPFLISVSKYVKSIIGIEANRGTYKFLQANINLMI